MVIRRVQWIQQYDYRSNAHEVNNMKNLDMIEKAKTALDMKFDSDDLGPVTFREYFHRLLQTLWYEDEGFSGKRPFGNSGWSWDLFRGLVACGVIKGSVDAYGDLDIDRLEASVMITTMISVMCGVEK
jgi:hypothetical protein